MVAQVARRRRRSVGAFQGTWWRTDRWDAIIQPVVSESVGEKKRQKKNSANETQPRPFINDKGVQTTLYRCVVEYQLGHLSCKVGTIVESP
jgi:hypothetical protein